MDRLTRLFRNYLGEQDIECIPTVREAIFRLAEYENTNLSPSEIEQLKSENAVLRKVVEIFLDEAFEKRLISLHDVLTTLNIDENTYFLNHRSYLRQYYIQQAEREINGGGK